MIFQYLNNNKVCTSWMILPALFALGGCESKSVCPKDLHDMPATIVSISGPEMLSIGEKTPITIGIRNTDSVCVQEAKAEVVLTGKDTLSISAALSFLPANKEKCDCISDSLIYTLFYFTPTTSGNYHFKIIGKLDSTLEPVEGTPILNISVP